MFTADPRRIHPEARSQAADFLDRSAISGVTTQMTPHDRLFRSVFAQPDQAAPQLRYALPAVLARRLQWPTLSPENATWVDAQLRERVADLLFSVRTARSTAHVRLLFEHQSTSPPDLPLRLLGYSVRGWEAQHAERTPLSPLIPVVVFNGASWTAPRRFGAMLAGSRRILRSSRPYVPDTSYVLVDLNQVDPRGMHLRGQGEVALLLLKHARDGELWERFASLDGVRRAVEESGLAALEQLVRYVGFIEREGPPPGTLAQLERRVGRDVMSEVKSWGEQLLEQGLERGREQGLQRERALVERLLASRFGPLPDEARARLAAADADTLEAWAERILVAPSLDDV
ncbi:MAG: Rpn family recombination-promoting nuclease/putative transposase, partial [Myxococcaceae bacterium]|nr:Rpn family recombination-promoting nuclease/putative transposase [Myxococcaceae bacterium]